jgi:membrane associated rhomboid family serine protease
MMSYGASRITPAIKNLLIATIAVFVLQVLPIANSLLMNWGALIPSSTFLGGELWRLGSYMFLHGSPYHLLFNMLALYMFGAEIEELWGSRRFVVFYFIVGIGSGLFNAFNLLNPFTSHIAVIGASGAVLGVMTVFASYFPRRQILVFFLFPLEVRWAVIIFGSISLYFSISGGGGAISHLTHLGGILIALLYLRYYDTLAGWLNTHRSRALERQRRQQHQQEQKRKQDFEQNIDPLLKKISVSGMDSLTKNEKQALFAASQKHRDSFKSRGIIPFDPRDKR